MIRRAAIRRWWKERRAARHGEQFIRLSLEYKADRAMASAKAMTAQMETIDRLIERGGDMEDSLGVIYGTAVVAPRKSMATLYAYALMELYLTKRPARGAGRESAPSPTPYI